MPSDAAKELRKLARLGMKLKRKYEEAAKLCERPTWLDGKVSGLLEIVAEARRRARKLEGKG